MLFNSYIYVLIFLPLTIIFYHLFKKSSLHNIVLLIASYIFYSWGKSYLLIFIIISSYVDYFVGVSLEKTDDASKRKRLLFLSLVVNLGLLSTLKYLPWIVSCINNLAAYYHSSFKLIPIELPLPPGISFYTFQTLSYTIDVYRRKTKANHNLVDFFTYIAFFPQLIAGPIERCSHLLPQITKKEKKVTAEDIDEGIFLISWGLFKKIVFADNLGYVTQQAFENIKVIPGIALIAIFAFCFQIYCDFSAYTDIARGSAKFFGIHLTRNFLTPYFAVSPSDFWRRWHISLSTWLRDYLYIPLGGNRRGVVIGLRNLLITMLLGGMWHGAGLFFIVWGLYHGILLIFYRVCPIDQFLVKYFKGPGQCLAVLIMFCLTCVGWTFFISDPSSRFPLIVQNLSLFCRFPFHADMITWLYPMLLFTVPIIFTETIAYRNKCEFVDLYSKFNGVWRVLIYLIIFYGIVFLGKREAYDFIYFQF